MATAEAKKEEGTSEEAPESVKEVVGLASRVEPGDALRLGPGAATEGAEANSNQGSGCHCLEFESWWNEGSNRRYVYIRYNIPEGAFQMAIDEDSNLYHVPVAYGARTGEAVSVWDLHVGAELDILGRMTTLQRCSQTTAQWNKYWAERLLGIHKRLVEELRKYESRKAEPWLTFQKPGSEAGSADLRLIMVQVHNLNSQLHEYRPRLAAQLCLPKEMLDIENMPHKRQALKQQAEAAEAAA